LSLPWQVIEELRGKAKKQEDEPEQVEDDE
jgi:hypothetical protein